ncbi:MAG: glycerol-3-phosphate dehydrogenase/oxidase, partial [Thermoplasmatota archaeon]
VENAEDAARHGAVVVNHAEAIEFRLHNGRVVGARIRDNLTAAETDARAKVTLNMTGPWLSQFDVAAPAKHGSTSRHTRLRMTKGIHLVTPRLTNVALVLKAPGDERTFFAVPWFGRSLVGTTDTDYTGDLDDVSADDADIAYMIASARAALPNAPIDAIEFTYGGVRSLLAVEGVNEGAVSRRHQLVDHEKSDGIPGLFSLVGGKITPYRGVAEEIIHRIVKRARLPTRPSDTRTARLPGARFANLDALVASAVEEGRALGIAAESARHLAELYGSRYREILARARRDPTLAKTLCGHGSTLGAQIRFAVEEEAALTCGDALERRTIASFEPCEALDEALPTASAILADALGWSAEERAASEAAYRREIAKRHRFKRPG